MNPFSWTTRATSASDYIRVNYSAVFGWCLQITENDVTEAEDLIQDAYVLLRNSTISTAALRNTEGYIYVILRNLHRSRYERRRRHVPIPILDYDCARIGLATADSSHRLELADQLRTICRFACQRKETSRAGSTLLLRFFHGYYPAEIAAVLATSRDAVDELLRNARREVSDWMADSGKPPLAAQVEAPQPKRDGAGPNPETLLGELRRAIFDSCTTPCPPPGVLERAYRPESISRPSTPLLAHVVSCAECLERVNRLLNLSPLEGRDPNDTAGKQSGPPAVMPPRGPGRRTRTEGLERRTLDVYEHEPRTLCVAVNGQPVVLQRLSGGDFEVTVKLHQPGGIDFVEVFSEQDIRLLMIPIVGTPPEDPFQQSAMTMLSGGRTLSATYSHTSPWPSLQVTYETGAEPMRSAAPAAAVPVPRRWRPNWRWAGAMAGMTAIFLYVSEQSRFGAAEARTLLEESAAWERAASRSGGTVLRQRFRFAEKTVQTRQEATVEVWRGAGRRGRHARLLDSRGRVVATSDTQPDRNHVNDAEWAWQFEPSTESFAAFTFPGERLTSSRHGELAEVAADHVTLVLHRQSGRPVRELLRMDGREFEFAETTFDVVPAAEAPKPAQTPQHNPTPDAAALPAALAPVRRETAPTPEQLEWAELEARVALHRTGADLQESPQLRQTRGRVLVDLVVDSRERRGQLQRELAQVPLIEPRFRVLQDLPSPRPAAVVLETEPAPERYPALMQEWLLQKWGSVSAANQAADAAATAADDLRQHSAALGQLAERYGTKQLALLGPDARQELARLVESHLREFDTVRRRFDERVLDVVRPVARGQAAHSTQPAPRGWAESSRDLAAAVDQMHRMVSSLFMDSTRRPDDTLPGLAARLLECGQRIPALTSEIRAGLAREAAR